MAEVLTRTIALHCSPAHAFEVFTAKTDLWWPRGHRRTTAATMVLEPVLGGRLMEKSPDGSEWVIGKITAFEPPVRLSFDWFPGSPAAPTAVDVGFRPARDGAEIAIVHRALSEGAIAAWPGRIALFEKGWDTVLPALAALIENDKWEDDVAVKGSGTKDDPWQLKTPPGTSELLMWKDAAATPPALVCIASGTELRYHISAAEDLAAMLKQHGDWMELGNADEQKEAKPGTVEAWARSPDNPKKGWYGLKKGLRGRFANYVTPVAEALGLVELEHNPKNNRVRAK